jgi:hypothetical protein
VACNKGADALDHPANVIGLYLLAVAMSAVIVFTSPGLNLLLASPHALDTFGAELS